MPTTSKPAAAAPAFATTKIDVMSDAAAAAALFDPSDVFAPRHIGPSDHDIEQMLSELGYATLEELTGATVPDSIRLRRELELAGLAGRPKGESELLGELQALAGQNKVFRSFIGTGYYGTITPPVILRNILENPGWYTQYTPYQAEIAQGRLEALLNFQTMVSDLTGLPLAGASLLDEATAAAEAMAMCSAIHDGRKTFLAADDCHPQTLAVMKTRAESMGIDLRIVPVPPALRGEGGTVTPDLLLPNPDQVCGVLVQYPNTSGTIYDYRPLVKLAHTSGVLVVMATDLLALTLLTPPGELGADIAIGSAQRFGVPMGAGGPHAAFIATRPEYVRKMPGRIIGVSRDAQGNTAFRMAIQTREQHIKREKATSNICTAQALLAIISGMYAAYHGPKGLARIARRVHRFTGALGAALAAGGHQVAPGAFFDTLRVRPARDGAAAVLDAARRQSINLRDFGDGSIGISFDETTTREDFGAVLGAFGGSDRPAGAAQVTGALGAHAGDRPGVLPAWADRASPFLTHPIFNSHHSEHEMLRYIFRLQGRDLSLAHSMISLGSCTMKLNATSEMIPVTWREFGQVHPFAPADQQRGYAQLYRDLESWLAEITGFAAVSLQPNAGSQGEYAGLCVIRAYHTSRGDPSRDICLIPESAHGTNPASAVIAGLRVVAVACDDQGNIDVADLRAKAQEHQRHLAAFMVTYPSTYGVFEESIREICEIVHLHGGQVYMDGANMNAQVGLCRPGDIGADVCHLNLHKTFCIPHGGGGPGMGPIGVAAHLAPFLPGHPVFAPASAGEKAIGPVSAAPYGSPSILPISWVYIALMGPHGLKRATQVAILSANYMAKRLAGHYPMLFTGRNGRNAHEFIVDCRGFEKSAGIKVDDIAKRLMDFGFHAPTMSFPVPGTLMIEPTESEPKEELDRFVDAMIAIRAEIGAIEEGKSDRTDNPLKHAPHTAAMVTASDWKHSYSREQAAFPLAWVKDRKFWPHVARIDNPFGDRNLICSCPPMRED